MQTYARGMLLGLRQTLKLAEAYDLTPGEYDATRGMRSLHFRTRAESPARNLLQSPDSSEGWAQLRRTGADPGVARCLLTHLLNGAQHADAATLERNYATTAARCGWTMQDVARFVTESGLWVFAPYITTTTVISVSTRTGNDHVLITTPLANEQSVRRLAAALWRTTEILPDARLPVSTSVDPRAGPAYQLGLAFGALVMPMVLVSAFALVVSGLLVRLGTTSATAVLVPCVSVIALATLVALRAKEFSIETVLAMVSSLATCVLLYRPLSRRVSRRASSR
jgi:hypothetical protein